MRSRCGLLLRMAAVAVMVGTAGNAALAQRSQQDFSGSFTQKVDCSKKGSINATLGVLS